MFGGGYPFSLMSEDFVIIRHIFGVFCGPKHLKILGIW